MSSTLATSVTFRQISSRGTPASFGAVGTFLTTLSFLVTTPEARQEGEGMLVPSPAGQFLFKDTVLLAAALLTAAESLRAAPAQPLRRKGPTWPASVLKT
jgi:uncharacterized membrane protein YkgB